MEDATMHEQGFAATLRAAAAAAMLGAVFIGGSAAVAANFEGAAPFEAASQRSLEPVPARVQVALELEAARQLAESGQPAQAAELLPPLRAQAQGDAALTALSQVAAIEISAWAAGAQPAQSAAAVRELLADAERIADPLARVRALSEAGVAFSRQPQLPRSAARNLIGHAGELAAKLDAAQRDRAMAEWAGALATALLYEGADAARAGRWSQVRAHAAEVDKLARESYASQRVQSAGDQLQAMLEAREVIAVRAPRR